MQMAPPCPILSLVGRQRGARAAGPFTAMQHCAKYAALGLEVGPWMVIIEALSCGATAPPGISG